MAFDMKSIQALMGNSGASGPSGAGSLGDRGSSSGLGTGQGSQTPVWGTQGQIPQQGTPEWDEWLKKLLGGQGVVNPYAGGSTLPRGPDGVSTIPPAWGWNGPPGGMKGLPPGGWGT